MDYGHVGKDYKVALELHNDGVLGTKAKAANCRPSAMGLRERQNSRVTDAHPDKMSGLVTFNTLMIINP